MSKHALKAIETLFKGYRFRSRLEARWACFFDAAGIRWEYEKEGFQLENGVLYLPDFWLPDHALWIEIKPSEDIGESDKRKLIAFDAALTAQWRQAPESQEEQATLLIFAGQPYYDGKKHEYTVLDVMKDWKTKVPGIQPCPSYAWADCPLCGNLGLSWVSLGFSSETEGVNCMHCDCVDRNWKETTETWFHKGTVETKLIGYIFGSPRLTAAYAAARAARFEKDPTHA